MRILEIQIKCERKALAGACRALETQSAVNTNAKILSGDYCNKTRDYKAARFASNQDEMHRVRFSSQKEKDIPCVRTHYTLMTVAQSMKILCIASYQTGDTRPLSSLGHDSVRYPQHNDRVYSAGHITARP